MTTRLGSGRGTLVGRGVALPVPIALEPAAYAGAYAYGEDGLVYYCDGATWLHPEGRRPHRVVTSAYTAVLADAGRVISITAGGVTLPAGVFRVGDKFSVFNNSVKTQDIVPAAGVTLNLSGTTQTGSQTLGPRGMVEVECVAANTFIMSGTGSITASPEGVTLVAPGFISSPLTLERAQASGVLSCAVTPSGSGLALFGADIPRFSGVDQRLLVEGQTTTGFFNSRLEGAATGTPGTPPTNTNTSFFQGLSREIVAIGTEDNIPYIDVRFFGTTTGGTFSRLGNMNWIASALNIAGNATSTFSVYVRLVGGSLSQISSCRIGIQGRDSAEVSVSGQNATANFTPTNAALGTQRRAITWTPSSASVVYGEWFVDIVRGATATVDVTLRIGLVNHTLGSVLSSPVLPPIGTPGSATRGADVVGSSLAALGIGVNGASTVLWGGVVPAFLPSGFHTLACLDDNSISNRMTMRINQSTGQLEAMRALNGVAATANAGAVTAGVSFKAGITLDGSGRVAASLNGGAVAAVTGGPASGLSRFRLGNIADLSTPLLGEVKRLRVLPFTVSDAELQSLVGALP